MKRRNTGPSPAVRQQVRDRADNHCERCGEWTTEGQIHHRKPRGLGGSSDPTIHDPSLLAYLCAPCHRHVESYRQEAYSDGWLVRHGTEARE